MPATILHSVDRDGGARLAALRFSGPPLAEPQQVVLGALLVFERA